MKSDPKFAPSTTTGIDSVKDWLVAFAEAVRSRDFDRGRILFAKDVVAFGTRAASAVGLEALVNDQWFKNWNSTTGFTFNLEKLYGGGHEGRQGDLAWAAVPWQSEGIAPGGRTFARAGRATFVLRHTANGWLAIHSHHSLNPMPENFQAAAK